VTALDARCACGHVYDEHDDGECVAVDASGPCGCFYFEADAEDHDAELAGDTRIDLGGGMVVPLRELLEDDE
jgi:hypothetical protein